MYFSIGGLVFKAHSWHPTRFPIVAGALPEMLTAGASLSRDFQVFYFFFFFITLKPRVE